MKFTPVHLAALLSLAVWSTASVGAPEVDIDQVRAAAARLIGQLVDQGVMAREKGDALIDDVTRPTSPPPAANASTAAAGAGGASGKSAAAPATVRVPYIPEFVRKELKEEIRTELAAQAFREGWAGPGAIPSWVRSIEWEGDLRLRAQFDRFADGNASAISVNDTNRTRSLSLLNVGEDRDRLRFRGRIGLNVKVDEHWSGGVRLTTGSATDPLSANQTLGNFNNRYTVLIDRAYLRYRYGEQFNAVAGRFGNPWFGTDLLWANDLSFDGVA
ncbi:MAG: putative porin, partial [Pseudomonadota bacterium]|nr:putative porin [Pseudomonadota bacterium]